MYEDAFWNPMWWARNLGRLAAVLLVGFICGQAITGPPSTLPDYRAVERLLANAVYGFVLVGGVLMLPMGLPYLAVLALLTRKWSPLWQRIAAVVLSPLIISLYLLWSPRLFLEYVVIFLGIAASYGLILALPYPRDDDDRVDGPDA
jgi:hypothetical protein